MLMFDQNVYWHDETTLAGERTTETDAPTISLSALCGRRLAVAEPPSALINIPLGPTEAGDITATKVSL